MIFDRLTAISPIDGRYKGKTERLAGYFSECALIKYRVRVEIEYFIALCELPLPQLAHVDASKREALRSLYLDFTEEDACRVKEIEKVTNHDVKAVEYFIKEKLDQMGGFEQVKEFIHFGLTSQDINNTSMPLMIKDALEEVYYPTLDKVIKQLATYAELWKEVPMLAKTHGQPASPTRLGKEFQVYVYRLNEQLKAMKEVQPYLVVTVPLVIEKIYKKNLDPTLSKWAIRTFWHMPPISSILHARVKSALKNAFGGKLRYFICGGAAMNPVVEKCLMDIHFPLSIGYGMTECGPLIGGNPPKYFKARSGGVPVMNMEVKIDEPNQAGIGEILVKGENVMLGYYKNPDATNAAFTPDGWLRTGDLGRLDRKQNIYIKGRNKTMFLGASGQNIYPEEIEDKLNNQEAVGESLIVEREGKLVALVFPDETLTKRMTKDEILHIMRANLEKLNHLIPSYSKVADIEVQDKPFEKTPKRSIKRFLYK